MRSSLDALSRDIEEIQAMASAIKPATDLLARSGDAAFSRYLIVRRRFDYSALIVGLYACVEKFVEDIITSYAAIAAQRKSYDLLPSKLVLKHLQKSAELLTRATIDQARFPNVTHLQLARNLFQCLSGQPAYDLNYVAIAAHDRNIRYDELQSLLGLVDITHDDVRRAGPLIEWYYNAQEMMGALPDAVPVRVVQQRLDDLVERRNDVAHRGGNPTNWLGPDEMQGLVEFVLALAKSIFTLFVSKYLREYQVETGRAELLKLNRGPLQQKRVWVVDPPLSRLQVTQAVFALSPSFLARWGRVQNLRIGDQDYTAVDPGGSHPIGVMLDFPAPRGAKLYVLREEDDVVWPAVR